MSLTSENLNKFIKNITTGDTQVNIIEMEYYPKFELRNDEFVQVEAYKIKIDSDYFPRYLENKIYDWFGIILVWEESLV
jgi:hypothetical protein